jgi:hypothetical protein
MTADAMELHRQRITDRARHADPRKVALNVLTGLIFGLFWVLAKTAGLLWFCIAWAVFAGIEGWTTGWTTRPRVTAPPG